MRLMWYVILNEIYVIYNENLENSNWWSIINRVLIRRWKFFDFINFKIIIITLRGERGDKFFY